MFGAAFEYLPKDFLNSVLRKATLKLYESSNHVIPTRILASGVGQRKKEVLLVEKMCECGSSLVPPNISRMN